MSVVHEGRPPRRALGAEFGEFARAALSRTKRGASHVMACMAGNWTRTRALWRYRSHDRRFALVPHDCCQIANMLAMFATVLGITVLVLDPELDAWQDSLPRPVMPLFRMFNEVGKCEWIMLACLIVVVLSFARDMRDAPPRALRHHFARAAAAGYMLCAVAGAGIVAAILKNLIGRARPMHFTEFGAVSFDLVSFDSAWASFPSGHATSIMAFTMALGLLVPRLYYVCLTFGFWVGFARLATGAHYPSDVIAGLALGGLFSWLLARKLAQRRVVFRFDKDGGLVPAMCLRRTMLPARDFRPRKDKARLPPKPAEAA